MSDRVAIIGSREWPSETRVFEYIRTLPADTILVTGDASGVDTWVWEEGWRRSHIVVRCFANVPVNAPHYEKTKQYYRRNAEIADICSRMVAFNAGSGGTAHAIKMARGLGKPVIEFTPET